MRSLTSRRVAHWPFPPAAAPTRGARGAAVPAAGPHDHRSGRLDPEVHAIRQSTRVPVPAGKGSGARDAAIYSVRKWYIVAKRESGLIVMVAGKCNTS
eukprot:gene85-biopygen25